MWEYTYILPTLYTFISNNIRFLILYYIICSKIVLGE